MSMTKAPDIPEQDELEELTRNELRTIAAEHNIPAGNTATKRRLRILLRRLRDEGGRVMKCPNGECGHVWVYQGEAPKITSCPRCKSSATIEKNTLFNTEA